MQFGLSSKQSNKALHSVWVCKNLSVKHYWYLSKKKNEVVSVMEKPHQMLRLK